MKNQNRNTKIVIALSGGPDSVYLLHYLVELQKKNLVGELIVAHLDHEWRPDSHDDLLFCKKLSEKYELEFEAGNLSNFKAKLKWNGSKEAFAREARRAFLKDVRKKHSADYIALAHHADDQTENFFIRLARGASLSGLSGMKAQQENYIRPLLSMRKKDILEKLAELGLPYLTDPTNNSKDFLRNRIRLEVIPALQEADERFANNTIATINRLQQIEEYLQKHTEQVLNQISQVSPDSSKIECQKLCDYPVIMQQRILLAWLCREKAAFTPSESFFTEILRFLSSAQGGSHAVAKDWTIVKKSGFAQIQKRN